MQPAELVTSFEEGKDNEGGGDASKKAWLRRWRGCASPCAGRMEPRSNCSRSARSLVRRSGAGGSSAAQRRALRALELRADRALSAGVLCWAGALVASKVPTSGAEAPCGPCAPSESPVLPVAQPTRRRLAEVHRDLLPPQTSTNPPFKAPFPRTTATSASTTITNPQHSDNRATPSTGLPGSFDLQRRDTTAL